ncbi:MAG: hypothetical protein U0235_04395 [Polyangiaceae bacterium]
MTVRLDSDLVMIAAGGLMGVRTGVSLMVGACLNYFIFVPWMAQRGDIVGKMVEGEDGLLAEEHHLPGRSGAASR